MEQIQQARLAMHRRYLKQSLKKQKVDRQAVNFEAAKSFGLLFNATELEQRDIVLKYAEALREQQKSVRLLGFFDSKLEDSNFVFKYFNRKKIDWALRPKGPEVDEFIEKPFDILMNIDSETSIFSEYIAALSNAHLRVGPITPNTYCYDLMIDTSGSKDLRAFIQQAEFLLRKTNSQHEATPF